MTTSGSPRSEMLIDPPPMGPAGICPQEHSTSFGSRLRSRTQYSTSPDLSEMTGRMHSRGCTSATDTLPIRQSVVESRSFFMVVSSLEPQLPLRHGLVRQKGGLLAVGFPPAGLLSRPYRNWSLHITSDDVDQDALAGRDHLLA